MWEKKGCVCVSEVEHAAHREHSTCKALTCTYSIITITQFFFSSPFTYFFTFYFLTAEIIFLLPWYYLPVGAWHDIAARCTRAGRKLCENNIIIRAQPLFTAAAAWKLICGPPRQLARKHATLSAPYRWKESRAPLPLTRFACHRLFRYTRFGTGPSHVVAELLVAHRYKSIRAHHDVYNIYMGYATPVLLLLLLLVISSPTEKRRAVQHIRISRALSLVLLLLLLLYHYISSVTVPPPAIAAMWTVRVPAVMGDRSSFGIFFFTLV